MSGLQAAPHRPVVSFEGYQRAIVEDQSHRTRRRRRRGDDGLGWGPPRPRTMRPPDPLVPEPPAPRVSARQTHLRTRRWHLLAHGAVALSRHVLSAPD